MCNYQLTTVHLRPILSIMQKSYKSSGTHCFLCRVKKKKDIQAQNLLGKDALSNKLCNFVIFVILPLDTITVEFKASNQDATEVQTFSFQSYRSQFTLTI